MYSKKRRRNYHYINFHRVGNDIYTFITDLSDLEGVSINQIIMSLLKHSNRPKYVFSNNKNALIFKLQLEHINSSLAITNQYISHLTNILHLYWQAKQFKLPTEQNSYLLYIQDINQTKHQLLILTTGLLRFQHQIQIKYNLTSTKSNMYNQKYLITLAHLAQSIKKYKPIKPLHHINFRAPYHLAFLLKDLQRKYKMSYTQLLTVAVVNYKHVPIVISQHHLPKSFKLICSYLNNLIHSYNIVNHFFSHQIYILVSKFIQNPQLIKHDNSKLLHTLENQYHHFNVTHMNTIYQQYHLLIKANKKV